MEEENKTEEIKFSPEPWHYMSMCERNGYYRVGIFSEDNGKVPICTLSTRDPRDYEDELQHGINIESDGLNIDVLSRQRMVESQDDIERLLANTILVINSPVMYRLLKEACGKLEDGELKKEIKSCLKKIDEKMEIDVDNLVFVNAGYGKDYGGLSSSSEEAQDEEP